MSVALTQLEEQILAILSKQGELSLPQLVEELNASGLSSIETPQVRDTVWQLIHKGQVNFTPRRYVTVRQS